MKKAALKNLAIFTGKHLRWSLNIPVNIAKFLSTTILKNI